MKIITFLILAELALLPSAIFAQNPTMEEKLAKFHELEAKAPPGYPTLFIVDTASEEPGSVLSSGNCSMELETLGKIYSTGSKSGWGTCKVFSPGTLIYGRVHQEPLGMVVDLLDQDDAKPRSRRYFVTGTQLVNPNTQ